jgi:hypothetical protein
MPRFRKLLLAAASVAVGTAPAFAFFPPIAQPPGGVSVLPNETEQPATERPVVILPPEPPILVPEPPPRETTPHERCGCPTPSDVPEPTTIATAVIGLGVLVGGARWRKHKRQAGRGEVGESGGCG